MVTIKEAEMQTGITKQNIRYYEKIGLLQPSREQENKYRNYSEEDIRRLKLIVGAPGGFACQTADAAGGNPAAP